MRVVSAVYNLKLLSLDRLLYLSNPNKSEEITEIQCPIGKVGDSMKMRKLDLTKEHKSYYTAKTHPEVVEFGEVAYLVDRGKGCSGR
jgi:hypothetical protein